MINPQQKATIYVPKTLTNLFYDAIRKENSEEIEACGILAGYRYDQGYLITHVLIPDQRGTSSTICALDEVNLFARMMQLEVILLGWIHTHPSQGCFLSQPDVHTQAGYQMLAPHAISNRNCTEIWYQYILCSGFAAEQFKGL